MCLKFYLSSNIFCDVNCETLSISTFTFPRLRNTQVRARKYIDTTDFINFSCNATYASIFYGVFNLKVYIYSEFLSKENHKIENMCLLNFNQNLLLTM